MLQLSKALTNQPILSLRTGTQIGMAVSPIINPNNLKVEGFFCRDDLDKKKRKILLYQDLRDVIAQGLVVNDSEALSNPADLVRMQDVINLNFELVGKPVFTESKERVGKVNDYATEVESMYVQKLYVSRPLHKTIVGGALSVDRTQIIEITNRRIVIQDLVQATPANAPAVI